MPTTLDWPVAPDPSAMPPLPDLPDSPAVMLPVTAEDPILNEFLGITIKRRPRSIRSGQGIASRSPAINSQPTPAYAFQPFSFSGDSHQALVTKPRDLSYDQCHTATTEVPPTMVDLSSYTSLHEPPANGMADPSVSDQVEKEPLPMSTYAQQPYSNVSSTHPEALENDYEIYAEYSGNVKILVQLVNELPANATKQLGAQIIRMTMEATGISMEEVLGDAGKAQRQLLDAQQNNNRKIEEYKTIIRKLETENRFYQAKATELSEIIDLFILTNNPANTPSNESSDY